MQQSPLKDKTISKKPLFETVFTTTDGNSITKKWEAASVNTANKYRAIFVLSNKVNGANTKIREK